MALIRLLVLLLKPSSYKTLWHALRTEPWRLILINLVLRVSGKERSSRIEIAEKLYYPKLLRQERRQRNKRLKSWMGGARCKITLLHLSNQDTRDELLSLLHPLELQCLDYQWIGLQQDGSFSMRDLSRFKHAETDWLLIVYGQVVLSKGAVMCLLDTMSASSANAMYGNHDHLVDGKRRYPQLKPPWDIYHYRHQNYIGKLLLVDPQIAFQQIKAMEHLDTISLYSFWLCMLQDLSPVAHLQDVLYHDLHPVPALDAHRGDDRGHLLEHLRHHKLSATVYDTNVPGLFGMRYESKRSLTVEIIIPYRDAPELLETCVSTLLSYTEYPHFRVCLCDNDSTDPLVISYVRELCGQRENFRYLKVPGEFNYSRINNVAVMSSDADAVLLLNNDTEIIESGWLDQMVALLECEDIGAVGAKLLYPDRTIQHAGVILGIGNGAGHVFLGYPEDDPGYMNRLLCHQQYPAVTGACLLTLRELFISLGGLDEQRFPIDFNDVDYCLRVGGKGLKSCLSQAKAIHHESKSRGVGKIPDQHFSINSFRERAFIGLYRQLLR